MTCGERQDPCRWTEREKDGESGIRGYILSSPSKRSEELERNEEWLACGIAHCDWKLSRVILSFNPPDGEAH
jgi:hypothetical protein